MSELRPPFDEPDSPEGNHSAADVPSSATAIFKTAPAVSASSDEDLFVSLLKQPQTPKLRKCRLPLSQPRKRHSLL
jgi:hypothetical protein